MARTDTTNVGGDQKFGRYYLREMLNSGGMSEIWLVTDGRNKPYALRKLKRELRFNFTARRRPNAADRNGLCAHYTTHQRSIGYPEMVLLAAPRT